MEPRAFRITFSSRLVLAAMLAESVKTAALAEASSRVRVLIAFTHLHGLAEQALVAFGSAVPETGNYAQHRGMES